MERQRSASASCILIVDDHQDHADSLAALLSSRGYSVQVAYSSSAAIEQANVFKADIVLLDLGLPEIDGYELATKIRRILPAAMLIAVTGHGAEVYKSKARAIGIHHYFVKPVPIAKLREVIESVSVP